MLHIKLSDAALVGTSDCLGRDFANALTSSQTKGFELGYEVELTDS
jgi:hypothetical protein